MLHILEILRLAQTFSLTELLQRLRGSELRQRMFSTLGVDVFETESYDVSNVMKGPAHDEVLSELLLGKSCLS